MLLFIAYKIKRTFDLSRKTPKESNIYNSRKRIKNNPIGIEYESIKN